MTENMDHSILIVDDEELIGKALTRLIKKMNVKSVYAKSGMEALEIIKSADFCFSLIISDQRMPEMEGSVFLEKAKEITPDTVRFLITGYADMNTVTKAVNKGAVHRFITKPWENKVLLKLLNEGLSSYELIAGNQKLFNLAKKQHSELYKLNIKLKKEDEKHQKTIRLKEEQIAGLTERLKNEFKPENAIIEIKKKFRQHQLFNTNDIESFQDAVILKLYDELQDLAARNGFYLPEDIKES